MCLIIIIFIIIKIMNCLIKKSFIMKIQYYKLVIDINNNYNYYKF